MFVVSIGEVRRCAPHAMPLRGQRAEKNNERTQRDGKQTTIRLGGRVTKLELRSRVKSGTRLEFSSFATDPSLIRLSVTAERCGPKSSRSVKTSSLKQEPFVIGRRTSTKKSCVSKKHPPITTFEGKSD